MRRHLNGSVLPTVFVVILQQPSNHPDQGIAAQPAGRLFSVWIAANHELDSLTQTAMIPSASLSASGRTDAATDRSLLVFGGVFVAIIILAFIAAVVLCVQRTFDDVASSICWHIMRAITLVSECVPA